MTPFDLAAIFMALVAVVGWANARFMGLPPGVAMLLAGMAGSIALHVFGAARIGGVGLHEAGQVVGQVNFPETVVGYMLAFLLFAGAMQVDLGEVRRRRFAVLTLATLGVVGATLIVGLGVFAAGRLLHLHLPLAWAFVFGALISPTDPVAVLATVRRGRLAPALQAILQGEALFNDGVGIVVFLTALAFARSGTTPNPAVATGAVALQALGGLAIGLGAAHLVVRAMRTIDDYAVEVSLSIALAAGVYAAGETLHVSGAIAAVAAGLILGDHGVETAMSQQTRRYVQAFWTLVDENLNALLFLLLGLQMLVLPFNLRYAGLWAIAIPLVLVARLVTVAPWGAYFRFSHGERGSSLVLAWGGLRGALSLALALEVPDGPARGLILSLTYAVVVFSVICQGLTFAPLVAWLGSAETITAPGAGPGAAEPPNKTAA